MNLSNFTYEIDADGIALLTWNAPDRSMNVITEKVMDEFEHILNSVALNAAVKGAVIVSGKESFSAGADLGMLEDIARRAADLASAQGEDAAMTSFFEATRRLSAIYRRLETCGKPFAAAIHGLCLGGAFELALACHYRLCSDDEATRVGLPEIKIGLFPGAGGTQRVARLTQTADALQLLFKGEQLRPQAAQKLSLVHGIVPRGDLVAKAKDWIRAGGSSVAPWDRPDFKLPSGRVFSPAGMMVWPAANAIYRRETQDNYPAAKAILHAVYEGLQLPIDLGLRVESRWFAKILRSQEARAMIRTLFVSSGELNKGARRPAGVAKSELTKIGVVGAGFMGASIAYVSAAAGLDVVLIDRDQASAEKGKEVARKLISDQVLKGRAKAADRDALLGRIAPTADYAGLADCGLVIEAVFEDRAVKAEALGRIAAHLGEGAFLASNTSTLPITSLAQYARARDRFLGVHFFSPVERMPLVELICGAETSEAAMACGFDFVRKLKKTPILVNDSRGFFANRCVGAYLLEGHLMLMEGIPPALIENAARMSGMPVGPLALSDEIAVDLVWKILQATERDVGESAVDPRQRALLDAMVNQRGRLGRKNGKGFYDYPEKAPKRLWAGLRELQPAPPGPASIDIGELKHRFLATQALEAARVMAEGVLADPREADVGSIFGFGFAPFTGGVLSYVDGMGAGPFVLLCADLQKKHGERFAPNDLLMKMASERGSFYPRRVASAAA